VPTDLTIVAHGKAKSGLGTGGSGSGGAPLSLPLDLGLDQYTGRPATARVDLAVAAHPSPSLKLELGRRMGRPDPAAGDPPLSAGRLEAQIRRLELLPSWLET
jgi:hypothetical protein